MDPGRRRFLAAAAGLAAGRAVGQPACSPVRFVTLAGGRRLAYRDFGNPVGDRVVVYHHGQPSCGLEAHLLAPALAGRTDVRLIAFDRPGMGASDPVGCPSFRGWAADLAAAADILGLKRFGLVGTSAGSPFALAAALALGDRVTAVALACPAAEFRPGQDNGAAGAQMRLAAKAPAVARADLDSCRRQVERRPARIVRLIEPLTPAERRGFDDPAAVAFAAAVFTECLRQGAAGVVGELLLLARPWGLPLGEVAVPVALHHGTADRRAPPGMSQALADALPRATVRLYAGDGHLSLPTTAAGDVLAAAAG